MRPRTALFITEKTGNNPSRPRAPDWQIRGAGGGRQRRTRRWGAGPEAGPPPPGRGRFALSRDRAAQPPRRAEGRSLGSAGLREPGACTPRAGFGSQEGAGGGTQDSPGGPGSHPASLGTPWPPLRRSCVQSAPQFLGCPPPRGPELLGTGMAPGPVLPRGKASWLLEPPLLPLLGPSPHLAGSRASGCHRTQDVAVGGPPSGGNCPACPSSWRQDLSVGWAGWPVGRTLLSAVGGSRGRGASQTAAAPAGCPSCHCRAWAWGPWQLPPHTPQASVGGLGLS